MGKLVNQTEIAELLDITPVTVWEWQKQGLPVMKHGSRGESHEYDFKAVIDWLIERELKKIRSLSPRDEGIMLDNELKKRALAEKDKVLVPVSEVAPLWNSRVLAAAAFLSTAHSRLAAMLEAAPDMESRRALLRETFTSFLTALGVNGEAMQTEVEQLLSTIPADEAAAFLKRIDAIGSRPPSMVASGRMESAR